MPQMHDSNTLWVAISEYGDGNLFGVYPKILSQMLLEEEEARQDGDTSEVEKLVLPSDKEWRLTQYFFLVDMQKDMIKDIEQDTTSEVNLNKQVTSKDEADVWAPWNHVMSAVNTSASPPVFVKNTPGPAWDITKVLKAGRLLSKPPMKVEFKDEQEMRVVYSLIYDVFRYKSLLDQAIEDIDYFADFPQYSQYRSIVWLFVMELARRRWAARPRNKMVEIKKQLAQAGHPFEEIEHAVWKHKVHFAAAIARIRIKNKAFSISDLLPPHLREEHISACVNKDSVTGWVNTFKAKKVAILVKHLNELGFTYSSSKQLCAGEYRFDRVCPRFITLRPPANVSIGQLDLVKDGIIILQEREFCEGASTLCRALRFNNLQGVVAQTHASSPRCSAYLAAQLRELAAVLKAETPTAPAKPELGRLIVFGAGDKVESYVGALRDMGIEASEATASSAAVCVLSEAVHCDTPDVASALEGVVAALATPPNSYSGVTDPIDLVCGRGGDLAMLEILTESEVDADGKARVSSILEEQKKTLKVLMSKPQIQLILYETHSVLEAENQAQVTRAVAEANRLARERHALLKKKTHTSKTRPQTARTESSVTVDSDDGGPDPADYIPAKPSRPESATTAHSRLHSAQLSVKELSQPGTTKARPIPHVSIVSNEPGVPKVPDADYSDIIVPDCDLFEIQKLPILGNGLDINYILDRDGCYLGLIQRKEITRLDAKYMIKVAEERGLFGTGSPKPIKQKKKETDMSPKKCRRRKNSFEVARISAPTYSSIVRSAVPVEEGTAQHVCAKHARRLAAAAAGPYRQCACDVRHKRPSSREATMSPEKPLSRTSCSRCRQPFPVVIQEIKLKGVDASNTALFFI